LAKSNAKRFLDQSISLSLEAVTFDTSSPIVNGGDIGRNQVRFPWLWSSRWIHLTEDAVSGLPCHTTHVTLTYDTCRVRWVCILKALLEIVYTFLGRHLSPAIHC